MVEGWTNTHIVTESGELWVPESVLVDPGTEIYSARPILSPDDTPPVMPDLGNSLARAVEGDIGDFTVREARLFRQHLPLPILLSLHEQLTADDQPYLFLRSDSSLVDPATKQAFLQKQASRAAEVLGVEATDENIPAPLRTVTLSFPERLSSDGTLEIPQRHVLVASITSEKQFVSPEVIAAIGDDLGSVSRKARKSAKINSSQYNTTAKLGIAPGVVHPFISADSEFRASIGLTDDLSGVYYLPSTRGVAEVAITAFDSMLMPSAALDKAIRTHGTLVNKESKREKFKVLALPSATPR